MNKATFLDRDGVLNPLVYNLETGEYESPHYPEDFSIYPYVAPALKQLLEAGFLLFLVSNQPSYAKGKTTLENIKNIQLQFEEYLAYEGIEFQEFYYCYHHPQGIVPEYSIQCRCRKPGTQFLEEAQLRYELDLQNSWFIGDQDTDVECGQLMGIRTVLIQNKHSSKKRVKNGSAFTANNLGEAVQIVCEKRKQNGNYFSMVKGEGAMNELKIKLFADGAVLADMKNAYAGGLVKGFTTNPTLMKKAGITDYNQFAKDVLAEINDMPISFEVFSDEFVEMEREARIINSWGENVYIKIPITNTKGESSIPLIKKLAGDGLKLNVTAIMTLEQVEAVASVLDSEVPAVVSVFAGRIADTGRDPMPIMREAVEVLKMNQNAELLWASPREVLNVYQADECGCHIITITPDLLKKIESRGKDLNEFSLETVKMFYNDAVALGYKIV